MKSSLLPHHFPQHYIQSFTPLAIAEWADTAVQKAENGKAVGRIAVDFAVGIAHVESTRGAVVAFHALRHCVPLVRIHFVSCKL
jgi:hypothetical protein